MRPAPLRDRPRPRRRAAARLLRPHRFGAAAAAAARTAFAAVAPTTPKRMHRAASDTAIASGGKPRPGRRPRPAGRNRSAQARVVERGFGARLGAAADGSARQRAGAGSAPALAAARRRGPARRRRRHRDACHSGPGGCRPRTPLAGGDRANGAHGRARRKQDTLAAALVAAAARAGDVFTEYRDTLARLERRIGATGRSLAMLHGGMDPRQRAAVAAALDDRALTLLATDAAAEGLNLQHHGRIVIHYELPWNPARLEQRAGRVDRIGQTRRVHEIALVSSTPAERLVLRPLAARARKPATCRGPRSVAALNESRVAEAVMSGVESTPRQRPGSAVVDSSGSLARRRGGRGRGRPGRAPADADRAIGRSNDAASGPVPPSCDCDGGRPADTDLCHSLETPLAGVSTPSWFRGPSYATAWTSSAGRRRARRAAAPQRRG